MSVWKNRQRQLVKKYSDFEFKGKFLKVDLSQQSKEI